MSATEEEFNHEDDTTRYVITRKGYNYIWTWIRHSAQMHELTCNTLEGCDDMGHEVALILPLVIPSPEEADRLGLFDDR